MAFSTQKDFFYVPFMNQNVEFECKKACVQLKSYESSIDDRSWSTDGEKQSRFLTELVNCGLPSGGSDRSSTDSGLGAETLAGDSVVQCANATLGRLEDILLEKRTLQKKLDVSAERLRTADQEIQHIKKIVGEKFDSGCARELCANIQHLAATGRLNQIEEREMMKLQQRVSNARKAYDILSAENMYLKKLIEKLAKRVTLNATAIPVEPEKSIDIAYLQKTIDDLRRELTALQKLDEATMMKHSNVDSKGARVLSDRDAQNLKVLVKERNDLREKCKSFKDLERRVQDLQKKAKEADHLSEKLSHNLGDQGDYIGYIEKEMKKMQTFYEEEISKLKRSESMFKCQMDVLKEELMRAKVEAQKAEILQMEVGCLRNELMRRDLALGDYDCQYKQLMLVIEELQANQVQNLNDSDTQTCNDYMEDLAFFTSSTLDHIVKEMEKRKGGGDQEGGDCNDELHRLRKQLTDLQNQKGEVTANCEELCADAWKRLREMENENNRLKELLKSKGGTLDELSTRVDKFGLDVERTAGDTQGMKGDLQEGMRLVKDIGEVQLRNQQLSTAVNALNTRDDTAMKNNIDDLMRQLAELRRQLQSEQEKNQKCLEENQKLQQTLKKRDDDAASGEAARKAGDEALRRQLATAEAARKAPEEASAAGAGKLAAENAAVRRTAENEATSATAKAARKGTEAAGSGGTGAIGPGAAVSGAVGPSAAGPSAAGPSAAGPSAAGPSAVGPSAAGPGAAGSGAVGPGAAGADTAAAGAVDASARDAGASGVGAAGTDITGGGIKGAGAAGTGGQKSGSDGGGTTGAGGGGFGASGASGSRSGGASAGGAGLAGAVKKGGTVTGHAGAAAAVGEFVDRKSVTMTVNLKAGNAMANELRAILDAFIEECGFCFCQCRKPKSKFYSYCYKILHQGMQALAFDELIYVHKKIFITAERTRPGYLLNIIVGECRLDSGSNETVKCCSCKSSVCCNNSEEMLRDKVKKLEMDIEQARTYFEHVKAKDTGADCASEETYRHCCDDDNDDESDRQDNFASTEHDTCRNRRSTSKSNNSTRQLRQLKARILNCTETFK